MKKEMLEFINKIEEPKCFIICTDQGHYIDARGNEFFAMLTCLINALHDELSKSDLKRMIDTAYSMDNLFEKKGDKGDKGEKKCDCSKNELDKHQKIINEIFEMLKGLEDE